MHPDDRPSMEHHLLRALGDHTLDLIYAKDRQGCYTFVNSALWRLLGVTSHQEALGKSDFDFHPQEMAQSFFKDEPRIVKTGQPLLDLVEPAVDQETFLRNHACDQSQGFYFSRPITADEFVTLMRNQPEAMRDYLSQQPSS